MNSQLTTDERFIRRCIQLARCAEGLTFPNPMVGSVVVHDGKIIGEGYHRKAGGPHAEVHAIASVKERNLLNKSTLYVSLEPCAHFGKTPPCAKLIIETGIPEVVIGCVDTFSQVAGKGIQMLRDAGVKVRVGVCEEECRHLNRRFFAYHELHRPYVILKWAQSSDGFIGKRQKDEQAPIWLTNEQCRRLVHKQRAEEQAVMIGVGTAVSDNPSLTTRAWAGPNPLRVVIDPHRRTPQNSTLLTDGGHTLLLTENLSPEEMLAKLYVLGIQSVIIEGGAFTLSSFIAAGLWDEAYIYHSPRPLHADVAAPAIDGKLLGSQFIGDVRLDVLQNR